MILTFFFTFSCAQKKSDGNDMGEIIPLERNEAQLFIDDFLIESVSDVKRTLHQLKKDNGGNVPILAIEDEFGKYTSSLQANGTIVYDPKLKKYVMIALSYSRHLGRATKRSWDKIRLYRFTSVDGINWIKGDDGSPQRIFPNSREDLFDPLTGNYAHNIDLFSFYYDTYDSVYPYKGWQYFSKKREDDRSGIYYAFSKDGIHWEHGTNLIVNGYEGSDNPLNYSFIQDGIKFTGAGDVTTIYHDEKEDRVLGIFKFKKDKKNEDGHYMRSRAYAFIKKPLSEPFDLSQITRVELVPATKTINGDMPSDEYYASTAWRYGSQWLGGLKVWHPKGDYPYSSAGSAFLKLVSSRDGLHWRKVQFKNEDGFPEVFLANGKEGGNNGQNDGGYITEFSNAPLRIGDQLIFYYGASSWGKNHEDPINLSGGGIFRARLRIDGFVSVDQGTITTKLIDIDAKQLTINSKGNIEVELLDETDKRLGHQLISGDSIEHEVDFDGRTFGELSRGNPIKLRFTIKDSGELYSFKFRD
ncbi:hypothetical protein F8C76_02460 [Flagellimonas olearia]|uniref:Uncharacterized protein n=1 Tax=Flagellimonas olearia TaxID=552546 RepID=A0A6I1E1S6_9FLAO|nr:hypothetical protein [Allomuricauda olearia]KAB7530389.1 hypothetical protein F8C76_02460 [Allomuricauda olearia]